MRHPSTDYATPARKPRSRAAVIAYLRDHPRYHTMSSWNQSTSYARSIKVTDVVPGELQGVAFDMLDVPAATVALRIECDRFAARHDHRWQLGTNGRSGGYVVLYQGALEPSGYKSRCAACGRLNYQEVVPGPEGAICGACRRPARVNLAATHMRTIVWPGRATDPDEDFVDWSTDDLRSRVDVVLDLDRTVDRIVAAFVAFCRKHTIGEETVLVERTVKVAVPRR